MFKISSDRRTVGRAGSLIFHADMGKGGLVCPPDYSVCAKHPRKDRVDMFGVIAEIEFFFDFFGA